VKEANPMKIIDLTTKITEGTTRSVLKIKMPEATYSGVIYDFALSSMAGTYIDFPGHIAEFDDGMDAANYPLEKLFMVDATLIRLNRKGKGREISAAELDESDVKVTTGALVVDAGWGSPPVQDRARIHYYGKDAIQWFIDRKIHLFVSDVYENHDDPRGIFVEFFEAGISTVCIPSNLHQITRERIKLCVLPLAIPGATQVPCRCLAIE